MKTTSKNKTAIRFNLFKADLGKEKGINDKFTTIYEAHKGDWKAISAVLEKEPDFKPELVSKLKFTNELVSWSGEKEKLVTVFQKDKKTNSMRDLALNFNKETLVKTIKEVNLDIDEETSEVLATTLHTNLFHIEPTAVVMRMLGDPVETLIEDRIISSQLNTFLTNQPEAFNLKTTSVYEAFKHENAFKDITEASKEDIILNVKALQRVVALSPTPEVMPILMKTNMTSAYRIGEMPEKQFIKSFSPEFGENGEMVAKQLHTNAINSRIRNEQALIALKEMHQGTGVDFIDKSLHKVEDYQSMTRSTNETILREYSIESRMYDTLQKNNLSWDTLFGSADFCECGECNSVYSAAAYFVELLQYLRNNNLDPAQTGTPLEIKLDPRDISDTPLEKLFKRRPDLGCLQLTCKNTNTILPYIDLVNEVMENYIVFHHTKPFNVTDETTGELLAQPQNTEYEAYCILHKAVYPFTLPYHQPIDVSRVYLEHLETSRHELIDTFRSVRKEKTAPVSEENSESEASAESFTEEENNELDHLHTHYIDRAVDAEYLHMTQEEYVILTKEAFVSKEYWNKQCKEEHTEQEYLDKIGVKPVHEYYGYASEPDLLDTDESTSKGLTFVKDQFLRRTGISYIDFVELLKTQCINPNIPQGKALTIMESIQFSYRYLQTLVDHGASSPKGKYEKLIAFLTKTQPLVPLLDAIINPDPCNPKPVDSCMETKDIEKWIHCYFERVGQIIVLENSQPCSCPSGQFFQKTSSGGLSPYVGTNLPDKMEMDDNFVFLRDCRIVLADENGNNIYKEIGFINPKNGDVSIFYPDGTELENDYYEVLGFVSSDGIQGTIGNDGYLYKQFHGQRAEIWTCAQDVALDNCDLDTVRLVHLDGSPVNLEEYDHIHRFIRLWIKLGWTIDEVDKALVGLSNSKNFCTDDLLPDNDDCSNCDDLFEETETCGDSDGTDTDCFNAKSIEKIDCTITPGFLHQLVAVKRLLDITGIELIKLLTFWTNISASGEKSLYKRLFLKYNLKGIDTVFVEDKNGNYLTKLIKITEHLPIVMAAFNSTSDDIQAIMKTEAMDDVLNICNLSTIYRYRLLSKAIGVKIPDFINILPLFGNPFTDAHTSLDFTQKWAKMEDTGFNYRQLNYIIRDYDDAKKPLAPTQKDILLVAKTLYDGLNAIDENHKDIEGDQEVNIEMVRTKAALLFPQVLIENIVSILEGTQLFITNAPKNITINLADDKTLKDKLKYNAEKGNIQIIGILTVAERTEYSTLSNDPTWEEAIVRIEKQQSKLFKEVLFDVFEAEKQKSPERLAEVEAAEGIIKAGDISIPFTEIPEGEEDPNTSPKKSRAFINVFLPYLRDQLTHRFVIDTLSSSVGLDSEVTDVLISEVLTTGTPVLPIYHIFESIKESAKPVETDWSGYLIPSAKENYTFIIRDTDTAPVATVDGNLLSFTQQEDPTNEWWSDPIALKASKLYTLHVAGQDLSAVFWKTPTSSIDNIPPSLLLPDFTATQTKEAYVKLQKAAILAEGFEMEAEEFQYLNINKADFDDLDFNALTLNHWLRIEGYIRLRNTIPNAETNILEFFKWTHTTEEPNTLSEKIAELTLWDKNNIDKLIYEDHFDLNTPEAFHNEINLLKLQTALKVADKIAMDIDLLFDWAKPTSNFKKTRKIADNIQHAIRAKYKQEDWEQVVKPLNDQIRNNQETALIAYLLQQPDLINWGVTDANGLFEYFLIDVQMDACMETSRIKQALSSVQLFVQRCFLGLEEAHNGITPDILDRDRWEWMQRYRVWEANRKVFLYPENWIESNLRDDKTPFFKELESELLQKDINKQNVIDALKSYLYKVDEVANMEIIGVYIEGNKETGTNPWKEGSKLHVFARTRNAPYFYYYRYFALDQHNWYPWEKLQVDIPNYDRVNSDYEIIDNGCYLTPIVWNGRLLIFFPNFMKKTRPNPDATGSLATLANDAGGIGKMKPIEYWEIKMGMSEYRNGKWTQKQLSKKAIYHGDGNTPPDIQSYEFVPLISNDEKMLGIKVYYENNSTAINTFEFNGSNLEIALGTATYSGNNNIDIAKFHHDASDEIRSLQVGNPGEDHVFKDTTFTTYKNGNFHHAYSQDLLGEINQNNLQAFFSYNLSIQDVSYFERYDAFGYYNNNYHELKSPYALYNWEMFFHTPMMLADALSKSQQFEEAMKWYHYVFNPMDDGENLLTNEHPDKRFWQFSPFRDINAQDILDSIFNNLEPNKADQAINEWRSDPFKPHLVARSRPVAYMKWVVMKYIDNLVAWGDYLFRQDTIESINQATQLYVLAHHILGKRPQMIPKRGKIKSQTYNSLLGKWDAFSNAMVELELVVPFSNQISEPIGIENNAVGFANIFGFSSALYFCIPNNPKLIGYWDTIDDRLFKIRHCLNIEGIFRKLPLFQPPIDPALLVQAAAQGLSIASVLNDLNTPMPNYRFYYLLQKSLELCSELKSLGGAMLSALEKKDNEILGVIRAKHEGVMQNLVMEIKKHQLEEAQKSLDSLFQNRKSPEQRMKYYLKLIGEDANKVPGLDVDFTELANSIETPVSESGLKLIKYEKEDMDKASAAADWQTGIGVVETLASILHVIPVVGADAMPFGIGVNVAVHGQMFGNAAQAVARGLKIGADRLSYDSVSAGKKGGFLRALQERVQQANAAGLEIKQIDKQILSQQIRISIANQEINNQQKLIDNAQEVEEFLKNKYTNEELYVWMKGNLKTVYHQVYSLAYELGKKAEKVFRFERGLTTSNFIQSGYWNAGRDGLLAGEQLYVGLKQLEAAYQEKRGHDYEITKHVSLRQINPLSLIELKETGKCEFNIPEILFDMDYAGHYKRRIKSISVSIPCIVGPYTGLNASLRLLEHKFRNSAIAKNKNDYKEKTEEIDDRFMTFNIPIDSIAASSAQNESGMFELNFKDERYLPFEGAGVISKWRLELPEFRQFDYDTISDAIVHVRYTANEGGERLKKAATDTVIDFNKNNEELGQQEGLFSIIDLKHDLSNEWHKAMQVEEGDTERVLLIKDIQKFLPYYVRLDTDGKPRESRDIKITDIVLTTTSDLQASEIVIQQGDDEINFTDGISIGSTKTFAIRDEEIKAESMNVTIKNVDKKIKKALMVVRFILK